MTTLFLDVTTIIWAISAVLILTMVFLERSDPRTIAFWAVVLMFLPIVGFIIYLCFGQTFYSKRQFTIKNLDDEQISKLQDEGLALLNTRHVNHEYADARIMANAMTKAGGSIYTNNNDVKLYTVGDGFFKDLFEDLRKAKTFIHIEFYIVRDDELANEFMDIMIQKAKEGLEVRLMVDALGMKGIRKRMIEFKKAGGEYTLFHRIITVLLSPRKNNRNHRKIAVIDGNIGYVVGFNIGDEYLGKGPLGYWRDSGVRVEGHGVIPINLRFFMDWGYATGKKLDVEEKYFPLDNAKEYGTDIFQLISGGPDSKYNPIELQYLEMINSAKKTLYIHTPYLVPDESTMQALQMATYSGVDVKIIMPDKPDHPLVYWTSLWYASELMKRGVRVFQYNRGFVHSKTLVADGMYCSVGSANLDQRSMNLNFETNAMIYSKRIGEEMDAAFLEDLSYCTEYSLEDFGKLTTVQTLKVSIARLFSSWA